MKLPHISANLLKNKKISSKKLLKYAGIAALMLGALLVALFVYSATTIPSPDSLNSLAVPQSTKIYDRTGTVVLYDLYNEQKRTVVASSDISQNIKNATIVAEDENFYTNPGFDVKGIGRAVFTDLKTHSLSEGGSTITQQLAKNVFLSSDKNFLRKVRELLISWELEWKYSKDQILTWYLNQVPYGSNAYGVDAASEQYFGIHAKDLTLAEAALLASLPKAPSYYSPYGNHPEDLFARQRYILGRMHALGYISNDQYNQALSEKIVFQKQGGSIKAPSFSLYIKDYLEQTYGNDYLQSSGLLVKTTLDWNLQQKVEEILSTWGKTSWSKYRAADATVVVIDPKTGQILAMAGSEDYFADPYPAGCTPGLNCKLDPQVNVALRPRQPGSSFKPFAYSEAFVKGYTPDTVLFDVPTEFNPGCSPTATQTRAADGSACYNPNNYTGKFKGPMTAKEALAQSENLPSVKMLYLAGIPDTIDLAKKMGVTSIGDASQYGLSLVLGGAEVTPLEETAAYGVFADNGIANTPQGILSVETEAGNVLQQFQANPQQVLDKSITDQISGILSSDALRSPVFGAHSALYTAGISSAAKTGTTQNYRDAWTVGYTPDVVVGVWVGNSDGAYMNVSGGSIAAAPIWNNVISYLYKRPADAPAAGFSVSSSDTLPSLTPSPTGIPALDDNLAGMDAGGSLHSILYYVPKDNPRSPGNSQGDPQYPAWEYAAQSWLQTHNISIPSPSLSSNPPTIMLDSPTQYQLSSTTTTPLNISVSAESSLTEISVDFQGSPLFAKTFSSLSQFSFSTILQIPAVSTSFIPSPLTITAKDQSGNKTTKSVTFFLQR